MLKHRQFGLIDFPDLIERGVNFTQLALQIAEHAFVALIISVRRVPLLFEALDLSSGLREFVRTSVGLVPGTLVGLL